MDTKIDIKQLGLKRYKIPKDRWEDEVKNAPLPIEDFGKDLVNVINSMFGYSRKKKHWRNIRVTLNQIRNIILASYEVDITDLSNETKRFLETHRQKNESEIHSSESRSSSAIKDPWNEVQETGNEPWHWRGETPRIEGNEKTEPQECDSECDGRCINCEKRNFLQTIEGTEVSGKERDQPSIE